MLVRFWGTRGSLPAPLSAEKVRRKLTQALIKAVGRQLRTEREIESFLDEELDFATAGTYGGNTSCVELGTGGEEYLLCDLGTGVREFGNRLLATHGPQKKHVFHFVLSHVHWDHIMGFPFFMPAYIPGNVIRIYGCHPIETVLGKALREQHSAPCFPVDFGQLGAKIEFVELEPGRIHTVAGMNVRALRQYHSSDSFAYRFEKDGKSVVYSTDSEHKFQRVDDTYPFVEFFREADLVIFDAMYSLADTASVKEDWGHSSNIVGVELCQMAGVKHLCLFHHEPIYDDATIQRVLTETIRFEAISRQGTPLRISAAYDGLELRI